jgi:hypothetical protein
MPNIQINTDGTRAGTQLMVDGKDLTANTKQRVVDIYFSANAFGEEVNVTYSVSGPYKNEAGEEQGEQTITYRFVNNEWINEAPPEKLKGIGQDQYIGKEFVDEAEKKEKLVRLIMGNKGE